MSGYIFATRVSESSCFKQRKSLKWETAGDTHTKNFPNEEFFPELWNIVVKVALYFLITTIAHKILTNKCLNSSRIHFKKPLPIYAVNEYFIYVYRGTFR